MQACYAAPGNNYSAGYLASSGLASHMLANFQEQTKPQYAYQRCGYLCAKACELVSDCIHHNGLVVPNGCIEELCVLHFIFNGAACCCYLLLLAATRCYLYLLCSRWHFKDCIDIQTMNEDVTEQSLNYENPTTILISHSLLETICQRSGNAKEE